MGYKAVTSQKEMDELYALLVNAANNDAEGATAFLHENLQLRISFGDTRETRRIYLAAPNADSEFQVNVAFESSRRPAEGLFVRDENGANYLTHTGRFHGYPRRDPWSSTSAEEKWQGFRKFSDPKQWVSIRGEAKPRYVVTALDVDGEQILKNLASALDEVVRYKSLRALESRTPSCHIDDDRRADMEELSQRLLIPMSELSRMERLLEDKRQVIFQGPPGTGKTYLARELAICLAGSIDRVRLVQFHPSYAYEDFVQGFRPKLVNAQPGFKRRDGPLVKAARAARKAKKQKYFLIIDEINRGNLAKIFGELYFLLEYRDEEMRLQYSNKPFSLPENLYIIGTMNTADRSIALVDLALRRRFHFVEFHPDKPPIQGLLKRWLEGNAKDMAWVAEVVDRANMELDDRHAAIGPSYFMKEQLNEDKVEMIWEHNVLPYIEEHLFGETDRLASFALNRLRSGREDEEAADNEPDAEGDDDEGA